jgi:hypothetical protein
MSLEENMTEQNAVVNLLETAIEELEEKSAPSGQWDPIID